MYAGSRNEDTKSQLALEKAKFDAMEKELLCYLCGIEANQANLHCGIEANQSEIEARLQKLEADIQELFQRLQAGFGVLDNFLKSRP